MKKSILFTGLISTCIFCWFLVGFSAPTATSSAAQWVSLQGKGRPAAPGIRVLSSDTSAMRLRMTFPGFYSAGKALNGDSYTALTFPEQGFAVDVGTPELPALRRLFAIPAQTGLSIRITKVDFQELGGYNLPPVQHPLREIDAPDSFAFEKDQALYSTDAFYPTDWATAEVAGIVHGLRLGQISLHPIRFNPVAGTLRVATTIELTVEFRGTDSKSALPYSPDRVSPRTAGILESQLINWRFLDLPIARSKGGVNYLIVVDDAFAGAQSLADFVAFHQGQGRTVGILTTSETGTSADSIKAHIQAEYDSNSPADLEYVLLVGDVDVIPFKLDAFTGDYSPNDSDSWYGWLEGDDLFSDVGVGRYPAGTITDLNNMVEKSLNFHNKVEPGSWLGKSLLIANGEQYPGKYTECKESVFDHEYQFDAPIMDKLYGGSSAQNPDNDDIVAAIEEGRLLVNYRGHASETEWWKWNLADQNFTTNHARALLNGRKTPIIYAIACLSLNMMESTSETLGEAFLRHDQGAAAYLGAIHPSFTDPNHEFDRCLYYAPWDAGVRPIGDVLTWANIALYNSYCTAGQNCIAEDNIAMYLWIGDPTIEIPVSGLMAPKDLDAEGDAVDQITLTWTDRSDFEQGFAIERQDGGSKGFAQVANIAANLQSWTDSGLSECGTYTYRMRAYNVQEFSRYTEEITTQTLGHPPTNLRALGTGTDQATLSWAEDVDGEQGFSVYRKGPGDPDFILVRTTDEDITEYVDGDLEEGAVYQYKLTTTTLGGDSAAVGPVSTITLPAAPENLIAASDAELAVALTWVDRSQGEDGYRIFRALHNDTNYIEIGTTGADVESYSDETALEGLKYDYLVAGFNASGDGPGSNRAEVLNLPGAPVGLSASPVSESQIHLSWADGSLAERGFLLERDLGDGFSPLAELHGDAITFDDTGLEEGAVVAYRIFTFNDAGNSLPSNTVATATLPAAPTDLTTQYEGGALLSWVDQSGAEKGFNLYRQAGDGPWELVATLEENAEEAYDSGFTSGLPNRYRLSAFHDYGESDFSNTAILTHKADDDDDDDSSDGADGEIDQDNDDAGGACGC